jgi:N-acylneuraminate cytidylyltransferase
MKVAVIPARGGSKRIPRKNVRPFGGKPMIVWSIEAALASGCFDRILVSTDDDEIAEVGLSAGAEVPFKRPAELSDDYTGTVPVIGHAIEWLRESGVAPEFVCCIYATAPFVRVSDIRAGLSALQASDCDYAFSVTSYAFPIQRAVRINDLGRVEMFQPQNFNTRSQDLEAAYHDAAQFYWGRSRAWLQNGPIFAGNALPILIPRDRVQDIDTPEDWNRAELMRELMQVSGSPM